MIVIDHQFDWGDGIDELHWIFEDLFSGNEKNLLKIVIDYANRLTCFHYSNPKIN